MENEAFQKLLEDEILVYAKKIRRHLHQHPELGYEEFDTTALIRQELQNMGAEILPLELETGVVGILKGTKPGKNTIIGIRADIDALKIVESTGLSYESLNKGIMHACGHDGHTAVLLGAAKMLSSMKASFSSTVKFIFQPAEEKSTGALSMIKAGVLINPKVDVILSLHAAPEVEVGKIGVLKGALNASTDLFEVKIIGKGGHGAYPHNNINPIVTASFAIAALQNIVSSEIDTIENVVVSVCSMNSGTAFNVTPDEAVFTGNVRCHNKVVRVMVKEKIERIVSGIAAAYGCESRINYMMGTPSLINHPEIIDEIAKAADEVFGENTAIVLPKPLMGGEDLAYFAELVPKTAMFRLGNSVSLATGVKLHNNHFDFNDSALPVGIGTLVQFILNYQ